MAEQVEKMTWAEVISKTAAASGQTNKTAQAVIKGLMETIENGIAEGKSITFQKLFTLVPHRRAERQGRNPKNPSEIITIPAYNTVRMKISRNFKERLNPAPKAKAKVQSK